MAPVTSAAVSFSFIPARSPEAAIRYTEARSGGSIRLPSERQAASASASGMDTSASAAEISRSLAARDADQERAGRADRADQLLDRVAVAGNEEAARSLAEERGLARAAARLDQVVEVHLGADAARDRHLGERAREAAVADVVGAAHRARR